MVLSREVLRKGLMPVALVLKDQQRKQPVNCFRRVHSLLRGFISESTILYGINRKNHKLYLSDYQLMRTGRINKKASVYLNNKVAFVDLLGDLIEMPQTLAIIQNGKFIYRPNQLNDATQLLAYMKETPHRKLVFKPIVGAEGRGIFIAKWDNGQVIMNDDRVSADAFVKYLTTLDDYFVSEFIQQGEFANGLFPDTLNTMRILTMVNPATQKAFIGGAVYRVGTALSAPTDNFRRHGLSVWIDPVTGRLGKAAMIPQDGRVHWYETHPDTGAQLTRLVVPHWDAVKETILAVSDYVYQTQGISYVGWDVVLTDQGISLLEGNNWPGVSLHQVHQPLLADPQVMMFYQHVGAVKY